MTKTIDSLLVANRGEIAIRIMRTARAMGIRTVAVFSEADRDAAHVAFADTAYEIGPAAPAESYLSISAIISAARSAQVDAIHPGYGFLAENAEFAQACANADIIFVGPSPETIAQLGSKQQAKAIARNADVPTVPGVDQIESMASLRNAAHDIGYPVLLKASAGGGGRGMRIVADEPALEAAYASAQREAQAAFGDDTMLLEKWLERPRHIEVQILGDHHGTIVHLFERECSIQRRYQKIVEETPAPGLPAELRQQLHDAALRLARAVNYVGAGTVEFIVTGDNYYFLEVNTRLQVEHPITEMTTGIDIVRAQLEIAQGAPLAFAQSSIVQDGHAIECRLCAEDADQNFIPASGVLHTWRQPEGDGLRVDSGIRSDDVIPQHYDSLLAKVISRGRDRNEARRKMSYGLAQLRCLGVTTNRDLLQRIIDAQNFRDADYDTSFLNSFASQPDNVALAIPTIVATLWSYHQRQKQRVLLPALSPGFRNNRYRRQRHSWTVGDEMIHADYQPDAEDLFEFTIADKAYRVRQLAVSDDTIRVQVDGQVHHYTIAVDGSGDYWLQSDHHTAVLGDVPRLPTADKKLTEGACVAPMSSTVARVPVAIGDAVIAGQTLVVLEAMKMEHLVKAPHAGIVREVLAREGDQKNTNDPLVVLEATDTPAV